MKALRESSILHCHPIRHTPTEVSTQGWTSESSSLQLQSSLLGNGVAKVCDAITQTSEKHKGLTDVFLPCAKENTPGDCLMDKYPSRVQFDGFDPKEEGAYAKRRSHLNAVFAEAENSLGT
jgi:hypothetical protein